MFGQLLQRLVNSFKGFFEEVFARCKVVNHERSEFDKKHPLGLRQFTPCFV